MRGTKRAARLELVEQRIEVHYPIVSFFHAGDVLSKIRCHDIVWLFVEQPNLSERIRQATAEFPELLP
jgi:hypothetical protein